MPSKPTVEELQQRNHNEDIHTDHVARLAAGMLEQCGEALGCVPRARDVIEASARLHDVAYADAGESRAERGAELIAREGVAGFSDQECGLLAAVVLLQHPDYASMLDHPLLRALPDPDQALRLAAVVRVADGLDHAHLQDARLKAFRIQPDQARLRVGGVRYAGNLDAAQQQADLWRRVFPAALDVSGKVKSTGARYDGIVRDADTVLEGVRRMLNYEFRIMDDMIPGMRDGAGTDPLHDFRVALRRFRALLRQFRRPLESTSAGAIHRDLAVIGDELSHARDLDATWEFLTQPTVSERFRDDPDWPAYLDHLEESRRQALPEVRRLLDAPSFTDLMQRAERLLRVEVPELQRQGDPRPIRDLARRQVHRMRKRLQVTAEPARDAPAEDMHELRRLCRRCRYWSESLAPILGGAVHEWAGLLKALSDALGGLNDMNVYLDRLEKHPPDPLPSTLPPFLDARREECWAAFQSNWARIQRKKLRQELKALDG